jgi:hypothetical protein
MIKVQDKCQIDFSIVAHPLVVDPKRLQVFPCRGMAQEIAPGAVRRGCAA